MYKINEEDGSYCNTLIKFISDAGEMGYSIDQILIMLDPSFETSEIKLRVATDLLGAGKILNRAYEHGKLTVEYERKRMIRANDIDINMAEKIACEISKEENLKLKINELFGL